MSSEIQRRLRRSKDAERDLGRHLIENDGPDPVLAPGGGIVSSTGRVGHITALQYDVRSRTYAAESKLVKMPTILYDWWVLLCQVAKGQGKEPLLRWKASNEDAPHSLQPMVIITESRHADLLSYEKLFLDKQDAAKPKADSVVRAYTKDDQLKGKRKK